jgi:serine/threonine protein kinase
MNPRVIANRYTLLSRLGAGRCGTVYLAEDCQTHTHVAVKTPILREEYKLLASIQHAQVPDCYGYYREARKGFLVMEWVRGEALGDYLSGQGSLDLRELSRIMMQLFALFQWFAGQDPPIAHRDLHTGNLLRTKEGKLVLIDFGRARRIAASGKEQREEAYSLLRFLDYSLLPLLGDRVTARTIATWIEPWRERFWNDRPCALSEIAQEWQALVSSLLSPQEESARFLTTRTSTLL